MLTDKELTEYLKPPTSWRVELTKHPNIWGGNWFLAIRHFSRFCLTIWSQGGNTVTPTNAYRYAYFTGTWPWQIKVSFGWIAIQLDWYGKNAPPRTWYGLSDYTFLFQTYVRPFFTTRKPMYLDGYRKEFTGVELD